MAKKEVNQLSRKIRKKYGVPSTWGIDDICSFEGWNHSDDPEEYKSYTENKKLPTLAFYMRSSKRNSDESNLLAQEKALKHLYSFFEYEEIICSDGLPIPRNFEEKIIIGEDIEKSGAKINDGLAEFIDKLWWEDVIIVKDISRLTRLNIDSDEFEYLHRKLFDRYRLIYILGPDNKPLLITPKLFIEFARLSHEEYQELLANSKKGNEVKAMNKARAMDLCQQYYEAEYTHEMIAALLRKSVSTIKGYIAELRKQGKLTRYGRGKILKRKSPIPPL